MTGFAASIVLVLALIAGCSRGAAGTSAADNRAVAQAATPASSGNVFAGCQIFPQDDIYNVSVINAPVDPDSSKYISTLETVMGPSNDSFSIGPPALLYINVVPANQSTVSVRPKVSYHMFPQQWPVPPNPAIEPSSDATLLILQQGNPCRVFESSEAAWTPPNGMSSYSGYGYDLGRKIPHLDTTLKGTAAGGLPVFAGTIKWEEVAAGAINHALEYIAPQCAVSKDWFVDPANGTDGVSCALPDSFRYALPYAARLRLRPSFDISRLGPQAQVVARAMQTYGMILNNTGCCNELRFVNPLGTRPNDGHSDPWHWYGDLSTLETIRVTDFEVLQLPPRSQWKHD